LSLPLPYACGRKATDEDGLKSSEEDQSQVDLEDDRVVNPQTPIILSEEDSDFDDEVIHMTKKRRVQRLVNKRLEGGSTSTIGAVAHLVEGDSPVPQHRTSDSERKGKIVVAAEPLSVSSSRIGFTVCDFAIQQSLDGKHADWIPQQPLVAVVAPVLPGGSIGRRPGHARSDGKERLSPTGFPTMTRQAPRPPQPLPRCTAPEQVGKVRIDPTKRRERAFQAAQKEAIRAFLDSCESMLPPKPRDPLGLFQSCTGMCERHGYVPKVRVLV
jgi:hypothetical protein